MTELTTDFNSEPLDTEPPATGSKARALKTLAWISFAISALSFFTVLKLPQTKIKGYLQSYINQALAPRGISFAATRGELSLLFGPSYEFHDVALTIPGLEQPTRIEEIDFAPSILPLLLGRFGATATIRPGDGKLKAAFSMSKSGNQMDLTFDATKFKLDKVALLPLLLGIQGSAIVSGSGQLSGDLSQPTTLQGDFKLELSRIVIEAQTITGFNIPRLSVSEGSIEFLLDKGKAVLRKVKLGKPGSSDDLTATLTGDIQRLRPYLSGGELNLKTKFTLSQNILKISGLLEQFIGIGKQPDGSYAFTLTGPSDNVTPTPGI